METFSLNDNDWTGITLTAAAAKQIVTLMKNTPDSIGLCLSVKQSGCAGFGYVFEMINQADAEDMLFERDGAGCMSRAKPCRLLTARKWILSVKG